MSGDIDKELASALATLDKTNVIELARRMGPETLTFLRRVVRGEQNALDLANPVPLALRLMAADLIRKFSALPTNVEVGVKGPTQIVYTGDSDLRANPPSEVIDVTPERQLAPRLLRHEMDPDAEAMEDSPSD